MSGWTTHKGRAVALRLDNIDTDQLIPARFMSVPRSEGYQSFLLHDLRRDPGGRLNDFPLNHVPGAEVIVAGRNFGCGSSREGAVYALVDSGIRVVVAESFGDIFASNAVNNGLLPARVTPEMAAVLLDAAAAKAEIATDLNAGTLDAGTGPVPFDLDPVWRTKLINGWDDIDLTGAYRDTIANFAAERAVNVPWSLAHSTSL